MDDGIDAVQHISNRDMLKKRIGLNSSNQLKWNTMLCLAWLPTGWRTLVVVVSPSHAFLQAVFSRQQPARASPPRASFSATQQWLDKAFCC